MRRIDIRIRTAVCVAAMAAMVAGCNLALGQSAAGGATAALAPEGAATAANRAVLPLDQQIAALVALPEVARAHWGIMVSTLDGRPIYELNEGRLFRPDSNAKLFTTAAAMALLGPDTTYETRVEGRGVFTGASKLNGDLVIVGRGDANLSGRVLPYISPKDRPIAAGPSPDPLRYFAEMADQVAVSGLKLVTGNVVGDDTMFPWEPYAAGWSIDDMVWGYGAPVSALAINDDRLQVTVTPGGAGKKPTVTLAPDAPYYTVDSTVFTVQEQGVDHVKIDRAPGSKALRVYGPIAVGHPDVEEIAIDDPAEYAAIAFKKMLEDRGIVVHGKAVALHEPTDDLRDFLDHLNMSTEQVKQLLLAPDPNGESQCFTADLPSAKILATHVSPKLSEDVVLTNKVSQNLHAELMLRQVGMRLPVYCEPGSIVGGARVVKAFLLNAGLDKDDFVFYDGSGLSSYDMVTPRAVAKLLSFAAHDPKSGAPQPWFADWKASLPVGGVDGTLADRFTTAPLKGHVFAKTGTHSEGRALSGYLECASGQTAIFSILVDHQLPGDKADLDVIDKIVAAIAAAE